jgi:hypothetical protein
MRKFIHMMFAVMLAAIAFAAVPDSAKAETIPLTPQAAQDSNIVRADWDDGHSRWRSHHRWGSHRDHDDWHSRWRSHHRWGSHRDHDDWHRRWRSHHRWGSHRD